MAKLDSASCLGRLTLSRGGGGPAGSSTGGCREAPLRPKEILRERPGFSVGGVSEGSRRGRTGRGRDRLDSGAATRCRGCPAVQMKSCSKMGGWSPCWNKQQIFVCGQWADFVSCHLNESCSAAANVPARVRCWLIFHILFLDVEKAFDGPYSDVPLRPKLSSTGSAPTYGFNVEIQITTVSGTLAPHSVHHYLEKSCCRKMWSLRIGSPEERRATTAPLSCIGKTATRSLGIQGREPGETTYG